MLEKDFFSKKRLEQLINFPELVNLEKWGKYCFIPLDIPRFEYPELVEWFFLNSKPTYKLRSDIAGGKGTTAFNAVDIILDDHRNQNEIWSLNLNQEFMIDFRYVYDRIMDYFPFKRLDRVRLWSSTRNITYHRDHTRFIDYPGAFRILLYDENHSQTLSLISSLPDTINDSSSKFIIPKLEQTNSFVWNNLRIKHGSRFYPGCRKILIILDSYELDVEEYKNLVSRSVDKYYNECLVSTECIQKFVNL